MASTLVDDLGALEGLDQLAGPVADAVKKAVPQGLLKDVLSGTWLGHPLHPLLTDIPIGSFTSAVILDFLGGKRSRHAADVLIAIGVLSALPTAAAGAADWSDTVGPDRRIGLVHGAANTAGLLAYILSLRARRRGHHFRGKLLGLLGMTVMSGAGYLGGHLSFTKGIGVNNAIAEEHPDSWTPVLQDAELPEGKPTRVGPVLLYRSRGTIHAIAGRCTHAGGPLEEGTVDDVACTVECPWHASVFRLTDGSVVHGPATAPEVAYDVRVAAGSIEVRRRA